MSGASFNKVLLVGNLTRDPEVRMMASGEPWARMGMAVNRSWKDKEGTEKQEVNFFNLVAYQKKAEVLAKYCKKGHRLLVEGRLTAKTVVDDKGQKRTYQDIVVGGFQFLDGKGAGNAAEPPIRGAAADLPGPGTDTFDEDDD